MSEHQSLTFGRGPGCDVIIEGDEYMSPIHCRVTQDANGCWWVEDLGSTNGTVIVRDGIHIGVIPGWKSLLGHDDKVRIGRTILPWRAK